jgi:hypothetical protein
VARYRANRPIRKGQIVPWPDNTVSSRELANQVSYVGSPKHKTYPSPAGPPAHYADNAKCATYTYEQWPQLLEALRHAIASQATDEFRGAFPSRAWAFVNGVLHEARLTNEATGEYHAFPVDDEIQYPAPKSQLSKVPHVAIP